MTSGDYQTELLEHDRYLTLAEVCTLCGASERIVIAMIREGIVEPEGKAPDSWRLNAVAVTRIRTAVRLQRDLGVNLPGAALALELLDELQTLRRRAHR